MDIPPRLAHRYIRQMCSSELLKDMLLDCATRSRKEQPVLLTMPQCPVRVVDLIFDLCHWFSLTHVEKYAAVDLYERFAVLHIKSIRAEVQSLSQDIKDKTRINLQRQLLLRIVSCISIVHKLHSQRTQNRKKEREFMKKCGQLVKITIPKCTTEIVTKSEIRVLNVRITSSENCGIIFLSLQTMGHRIDRPTVISYLQILLEALIINSKNRVKPAGIMYPLVYLICDLYQMNRRKLHKKMR